MCGIHQAYARCFGICHPAAALTGESGAGVRRGQAESLPGVKRGCRERLAKRVGSDGRIPRLSRTIRNFSLARLKKSKVVLAFTSVFMYSWRAFPIGGAFFCLVGEAKEVGCE